MHEKISKIQSSFEKNELIRQKLEYELTVSQQETNKEKRKRAEDQKNFKYEIEQLQGEWFFIIYCRFFEVIPIFLSVGRIAIALINSL